MDRMNRNIPVANLSGDIMDSKNSLKIPQVTLSLNRFFDGIIISSSVFILVITLFCLVSGITTVFMHLYYFPIILLSYRYKKRGVLYSTLLSLLYLAMVFFFQYSQPID